MRNLIVLAFAITGLVCKSASQELPPCKEVKQVKIDTDQRKKKILSDYIDYCVKKEWKNDKGIVMLREFRNELGQDCWLLIPSIDDSYKDNPPERFATFEGDIILIFSADSMQNVIPAKGDKNRLNQCLEQITGDRVYTRPTIKGRWADSLRPITNKKITQGAHRMVGGNGGTLLIVFNADGTYKKLLPV
ncbi:hypothetical protein [Dyadobacter chenhuakuii]|uniref:Uncharacterized protein n=1 Tax=Dyadobacter chenhuakuii TaxID=2909339 RepID=A0ABY5E858_9BACT|nr:hypothetical protein [Dyadobacter chenhuakuii]UTM21737.1 hypothetical protein NFI80_25425 [Dyadobacter chenhuakuii]